jgi:hypothetical protein
MCGYGWSSLPISVGSPPPKLTILHQQSVIVISIDKITNNIISIISRGVTEGGGGGLSRAVKSFPLPFPASSVLELSIMQVGAVIGH